MSNYEVFLADMLAVVPWSALETLTAPLYPAGPGPKRGCRLSAVARDQRIRLWPADADQKRQALGLKSEAPNGFSCGREAAPSVNSAAASAVPRRGRQGGV